MLRLWLVLRKIYGFLFPNVTPQMATSAGGNVTSVTEPVHEQVLQPPSAPVPLVLPIDRYIDRPHKLEGKLRGYNGSVDDLTMAIKDMSGDFKKRIKESILLLDYNILWLEDKLTDAGSIRPGDTIKKQREIEILIKRRSYWTEQDDLTLIPETDPNSEFLGVSSKYKDGYHQGWNLSNRF